MLDEEGRKALVERLKQQGWDQGCEIPWRADLFLSSRLAPLTPEGETAAAKEGSGDQALAFEMKKQGERMVVVSQRCDIVGAVEPLVEAIPLVVYPEGKELPGLNSSRFFVVDAERRLVADATRRLLFEKTLLPDVDARQLLPEEKMRRAFAAWCARRYSRVAFANDFVATVGTALEAGMKKYGKKDPEARKTIHSWRVRLFQKEDGPIQVQFLVVYDEESKAAPRIADFVSQVLGEAQTELPKAHKRAKARAEKIGASDDLREHQITDAVAVPMNKISLRDLIDYPAFNLEHMTYDGEEMSGVEPHEEALA